MCIHTQSYKYTHTHTHTHTYTHTHTHINVHTHTTTDGKFHSCPNNVAELPLSTTMATTTQSESEEAKTVTTSPAKESGNVVAGAVLGTVFFVLLVVMVISILVMVVVIKKKKTVSRISTTDTRTFTELNSAYNGKPSFVNLQFKISKQIILCQWFQHVASKHNDASLTSSKETKITQSQHYSEIDDITQNPSYTPQQQDIAIGEYHEVETVSRRALSLVSHLLCYFYFQGTHLYIHLCMGWNDP